MNLKIRFSFKKFGIFVVSSDPRLLLCFYVFTYVFTLDSVVCTDYFFSPYQITSRLKMFESFPRRNLFMDA